MKTLPNLPPFTLATADSPLDRLAPRRRLRADEYPPKRTAADRALLQYVATNGTILLEKSVTNVGESLTPPIYWSGRQWAVTGYGLERRDGCYAVPWSQFMADKYLCDHLAWKPEHDAADLIDAFEIGRTFVELPETPRMRWFTDDFIARCRAGGMRRRPSKLPPAIAVAA